MGSTSFFQPKPKTNCVRFLCDFRNLNRQFKRKPYPMPKMREIILNLEVFQYARSLDLNMVYYRISINNQASNLCTIILPWGKYKYKRLPMGICNSPDIFQEKMNKMFCGFEFIRAYIKNLLIIAKGHWSDHLNKLEQVLKNIEDNRIKWNVEKSFFGQTQMGYLGFLVTWNGIRPVNKN